jgi:hypothetical protein
VLIFQRRIVEGLTPGASRISRAGKWPPPAAVPCQETALTPTPDGWQPAVNYDDYRRTFADGDGDERLAEDSLLSTAPPQARQPPLRTVRHLAPSLNSGPIRRRNVSRLSVSPEPTTEWWSSRRSLEVNGSSGSSPGSGASA